MLRFLTLVPMLCGSCVAFLLCLSAPAKSADSKELVKVAILQFDSLNVDSKEDNKGRMISEFMTTAAVNLGVFHIVERESVKKIIDEMEFGKNGQNYAGVAQKIGSLAGADYVLSGSITAYKSGIRIDSRLIHVTDGTILSAYGSTCNNDLESILACSKNITEKVFEPILPTVALMAADQSAWALPDAMLVDKDNRLWLDKKAIIRYEQNARFCLQIGRNAQGFSVNTTRCDAKYRKSPHIDKNSVLPVANIQY